MSSTALVAYASKHGATAEVAAAIGDALRRAGLTVEVMPMESAPPPWGFNAVVLGSAVYVGSWRKEAEEYLERNADALAQRPVWMFSSGPTGEGDTEELMQGWHFPDNLKRLADRIQPQEMVVFHGKLDPEELNFGEKLILKLIKAPAGDFRHWDEIAVWAEGIAAAIKQREAPQES
jgi:menaquinone-dependent protoporphyrinogen oxidase